MPVQIQPAAGWQVRLLPAQPKVRCISFRKRIKIFWQSIDLQTEKPSQVYCGTFVASSLSPLSPIEQGISLNQASENSPPKLGGVAARLTKRSQFRIGADGVVPKWNLSLRNHPALAFQRWLRAIS